MSDTTTKATLAGIEALLIGEAASPRDALLAAYKLGRFDGMLEMATIAQERVAELAKAAA